MAAKANELSEKLLESNVIATLDKMSPLVLSHLLDSSSVRRLSAPQLIYTLNYMLKTKFAKTIAPTESFKFLEDTINNDLNNLAPSQINGIINVLSKSKSDREDLYTALSISIMENIKEYNIRTISNIINNFTNIARKTRGFNKFYAFMKDVVCDRLYTE